MNKIKTLLFCAAAMLAGNAFAQKLVVNGTNEFVIAHKGGEANLIVSLESEQVAKNTEFHMSLPAGLSVVYDEDEEGYLYEEGEILMNKPSITVDKDASGDFTVLIYKNGKQTYKAASGEIIILPMVTDDNIQLGEYEGKLYGIEVGDANGAFEGTEVETIFKITVDTGVGIRDITLDGENGDIYNTAGQRVSRTTKGLFIQNGKKVVKK